MGYMAPRSQPTAPQVTSPSQQPSPAQPPTQPPAVVDPLIAKADKEFIDARNMFEAFVRQGRTKDASVAKEEMQRCRINKHNAREAVARQHELALVVPVVPVVLVTLVPNVVATAVVVKSVIVTSLCRAGEVSVTSLRRADEVSEPNRDESSIEGRVPKSMSAGKMSDAVPNTLSDAVNGLRK